MIKGESMRLTVFRDARPKKFLYEIASKNNCKLNIENEEDFETGFIFKEKYITIWFNFEGRKENVESAYRMLNAGYRNYVKQFTDDWEDLC